MAMTQKYLQILGCGHSESIEHFNNNALVVSPQGKLLIDCGHTIKHALHAQQLNFGDIDAVYISHVHGDHVFGLERMAYEAKFTFNKRIQLIFHKSLYAELWEQTLRGSLGRHGDGEAQLSDYFDVHMLNVHHFDCLGNRYTLYPVPHTPGKPAFGICLNEQIFYSTDTIAIPELIQQIPFEVGFHDVTLTAFNPVHAPLNDLLRDYPEAIRKKLYLMSYQDNWRDFEAQVKREFNGFAKQGMVVPYD